jgi:thiol-disulfide isomerase/thioredoxin
VRLVLLAVLLAACSPKNLPVTGEETFVSDDPCFNLSNTWPAMATNYAAYEGDEGAAIGQKIENFRSVDQFEDELCLSQFLGEALVVDMASWWCGPCKEAAAESMELLPQMRALAPSTFITLLVQNEAANPVSQADVERWAETFELEYPVVKDIDEAVTRSWNVSAFPTFFFVAPDGTIVDRIDGKPEDSDILNFVADAAEDYAGAFRPTAE